jgi:hypothetical protein
MALSFPKLRTTAWLGIPTVALALAGSATPLRAATVALLPIAGQPTVEPRLRGAAGTPCVVEIFNDRMEFPGSGFGTYTPPAACPGPWAKVLLKLDVAGARNKAAANMRLEMDGVTVFWGAPQEHDGIAAWHLERDLTDYAAWLHAPRNVESHTDLDAHSPYGDPLPLTGIARLVFYPATAAIPAQHVPDVVRPVPAVGSLTLPRNIERAYLDVYAGALDRGIDAARAWYSCVPTSVATKWPALLSPYGIGDTPLSVFQINSQGCRGGSFREVQVRIDGQLAGIAPLFPWLPSDINLRFPDTVDNPAPSVQALDLMPYRVDLTPFAAWLNDGLPHAIRISVAGSDDKWMPFATAGQLLLYRDHGKAHLGGALTLNTLASTPAPLTVENTLVRSGEVLQGGLTTVKDRSFVIQGYVDTSHGRIHSTVSATVHFANVQQLRVDGLTYPAWHGYRQQLHLTSTADRVSRRWLGTRVLNEDRDSVCYPLALDYHGIGGIFETDEGDHSYLARASLVVRQERRLARSNYRPGVARYSTTLDDLFTGSHARVAGTDSNWRSARRYLFKDNAGSCYSAALNTANGAVTTSTLGAACEGGNVLRWFAHADGSPDSLGWAPMIP